MSIPTTEPEELTERILSALKTEPAQRASDLASRLGIDRKAVNQCLFHELAGRVVQDSGYRWSLRHAVRLPAAAKDAPTNSLTELSRLCRYYLECIGSDTGDGVSVFAASRYGDPDYVELPLLPALSQGEAWWNLPGVQRVLAKVRADPNSLVAWLGYPTRLREHRTPKWRGYFVEPVMLWSIELPQHPGDVPRIGDALPVPNFAVLKSMAMGDASAIVEEAARLDEELGLNSSLEDRPEIDELLERLVTIRPDWDWQEILNPESCSGEISLDKIEKAGIYNRAVILPGKRSLYTQGLESELKQLSEIPDNQLTGTALGKWLSSVTDDPVHGEFQPLIEVAPMNSEQRMAIESALSATHTVVTGPPGTGKSQVVTNLLVNAAWRGMKVLFASKNNKAVDVVEARFNGLGNRPVLLRLGNNEYQAKFAAYLTAMLSGRVGEDDRISYEEGLARHTQLSQQLKELDALQARTLEARNRVDKLEAGVEALRDVFGPDRFNSLDASLVTGLAALVDAAEAKVDALDSAKMGFFGRLVLSLIRSKRQFALQSALADLSNGIAHLELSNLPTGGTIDLGTVRDELKLLRERHSAAVSILAYQEALEVLRTSPAFENIARKRQELNVQIAENSSRLWRDWVNLAPSRLSPVQRKDIADYAALLQLKTGPDAKRLNASVNARERTLKSSVSTMFSCWAVTSLSARGKVPFEPGHFDLVVIDEASQCDIASALPLLFRAKRAVIIGDPMQLRHISAVSGGKDSDLQHKYGLVESRAAWMYSVSSLYDLAAGVAEAGQLINLRDHHRSHSDIIEFSNEVFYGGRLRVATRYTQLNRPLKSEPGVVWQDIRGEVLRPQRGGAQNPQEAKAIVSALEDLMVRRAYSGSVGVVTPFQAQAQLIKSYVAEHPELSRLSKKAELLVDTVHKFQGDERDVIVFSPVVSNGITHSALGFLRSNGDLFNVAITRARGLLLVVGDKNAAFDCGVDYLAKFASYVNKLGEQKRREEVALEPATGPAYPSVSRPERVSDWERAFYRALYLAGVRPIPQFSVEQYDLDFAIVVGNARLNVEVDGERYHRSWTGELCLRDQLRNQRLIELGWEVKRFWVYEIRDRLPECVDAVRQWVERAKQDTKDDSDNLKGT